MARGKSSSKPLGRPTKLTEDREAEILTALRAGNYRETVARYVGIGVSTLYEWLERGETEIEEREQREAKGDEPGNQTIYADFAEAVTRAEAEAEVHAVTTLQSAMSGDWRAAAEYLQRRHNKRWSRADRLDVEVDQTVHGAVSVDLVPDDERRAEVAKLLALYGGDGE